MTPPTEFTAAEARRLLDSGAASARELADFYLARIERLNPELCAVIAVDVEGARAAAAASDARRADGKSLGELDGVPILIKDNIEAVGLPGTAGSRALLGSPPTADAPLVTALRDSGLVVLGSTNLSEWANFRSTASTSGWSAVGGQTRNAFDTGRNTSGSSSGSGVAAAAGLAPLTIGTETDGSIVSPAGVCGVVGFKPTRGSVPGTGIVPISSQQDVAGPMTRSVADAASLYAVMSGQPSAGSVAPSGLGDRPIAVWRPAGLVGDVAAVFDAAVARLADAGCSLRETQGALASPFQDAEFDALVAEFSVQLPAYLAGRQGAHPRDWDELLAFNRADDVELSRFSDEIFQLCRDTAAAGGTDTDKYRKAREDANASCARALESVLADCDFAIAPTNAPAWPIGYGELEEPGLLTSSLCAVTGAPSISLPAGLVDGLPIGISVLARRGQDQQLLGFAAAFEALLPDQRYPYSSG